VNVTKVEKNTRMSYVEKLKLINSGQSAAKPYVYRGGSTSIITDALISLDNFNYFIFSIFDII